LLLQQQRLLLLLQRLLLLLQRLLLLLQRLPLLSEQRLPLHLLLFLPPATNCHRLVEQKIQFKQARPTFSSWAFFSFSFFFSFSILS
jgi:hypothetical protein